MSRWTAGVAKSDGADLYFFAAALRDVLDGPQS